jgi:hypothetical protein
MYNNCEVKHKNTVAKFQEESRQKLNILSIDYDNET